MDSCQTSAGFGCTHKWNQAKTEDQANHIKCHEWLTYRPPCTAHSPTLKAPGCQHDTPGTSNNAHIIIYCLGLRAPSTDTRLCRVPCSRSGQCRCGDVACRRHNVHYLYGACSVLATAVCLVNNSHAWPGFVELTATAQHKKHSVHNGIFAAYKERICEREGDQLRV